MSADHRENYFNLPLQGDNTHGRITKTYVLVIYDITDNKRRTRLAATLSGFGYRVQESAFEAMLTTLQLAKLLDAIDRFSQEDDNIRIYKIKGTAAVTIYGRGQLVSDDDFTFI